MQFIKFGAPAWCGSCKVLDNVMETWDTNIKSKIRSVDIDKESSFSKQFKIKSMPTLVVLDDNGSEVARYAGSKITEDVVKSHLI